VPLLSLATSATTTRWSLLGTPLSGLPPKLGSGEHRVNKVHVGAYRLLGERLPSLSSPLLLISQLLAHLPSVLRLGTKVLYYPVEEVLGELGIHLLDRNATLRCCPLALGK
jgi:hypothetical protein